MTPWQPGRPSTYHVPWKHYCGTTDCETCPEKTVELSHGQLPTGTTCPCRMDRNGKPLRIGQLVRINAHPRGTVEGLLQSSVFMCGKCHAPIFRVKPTDGSAYGPASGAEVLILKEAP